MKHGAGRHRPACPSYTARMNEPNRQMVHEVWIDYGDVGEELPALIAAGPRGDGARRCLGPKARLQTTISAGCHFDAMAIYYRLLGYGEYRTDQPDDSRPYPTEWIREQRDHLSGPRG